jgi:hypothetical protein
VVYPLGNDVDPDGDLLTLAGVTQPTNGSTQIDVGARTITYEPRSGFFGVDSFTYTATDGAATASATVTVIANPSPPMVSDDMAATPVDTPVVTYVLGNDVDPDGDTLSVAAVAQPGRGSARIDVGARTVTYQPDSGFIGTDSFTYTATDGAASASGTVTVSVGLPGPTTSSPTSPSTTSSSTSTPSFTSTSGFPTTTRPTPGPRNPSITIEFPFNGLDLPVPPGVVPVQGRASIGSLGGGTNAFYVIDASGSTSSAAGDCNGDGETTSADDLNGDGGMGDVLDCEISGALALARSSSGPGIDVGLGAFSSGPSAVADVHPGPGDQPFTSPTADANGNGVKDVEEVALSIVRSSIGQFTAKSAGGGGTDFDTALAAVNSAFATQPAGEQNIAFLLSDGEGALSTGVAGALQTAVSRGTRVNTYAIGASASCAEGRPLRIIADATGGACTPVVDPTTLSESVQGTRPPGIDRVEVRLNNATPVLASLDALGAYEAVLFGLVLGPNTITATVFADDGTSASASTIVNGVRPTSTSTPVVRTPTTPASAPITAVPPTTALPTTALPTTTPTATTTPATTPPAGPPIAATDPFTPPSTPTVSTNPSDNTPGPETAAPPADVTVPDAATSDSSVPASTSTTTATPPSTPPGATVTVPPLSEPPLQLERPSALPGGEARIRGVRCPPGSEVALSIGGRLVGNTRADSSGRFEGELGLDGFGVGRHAVAADCGGTRFESPIDLVVVTSGGTNAPAVAAAAAAVLCFFVLLASLLTTSRNDVH